jgi:predicted CoA-binding protein
MIPPQPVDHDRYTPEYLRHILAGAKVIAVVGASTEPWRASFGIMRYLQRVGYRVIPVNPHEVGNFVHGEAFVPDLRALSAPADLVNVFRRNDAIPDVVADAIAVKIPALWMQLGVRHDAAAGRPKRQGFRW